MNAITEEGDPYFDVAKNSAALHSAAWRARHSTVKFLIERGAAVDALDGKGRTPESVEALLDAGAAVRGVEFPSGYEAVDELLLRAHRAERPE